MNRADAPSTAAIVFALPLGFAEWQKAGAIAAHCDISEGQQPFPNIARYS
jgi:hypothetical protein